jgi:oligopeptide/dipeptide ABC transporter ATP-binding protein
MASKRPKPRESIPPTEQPLLTVRDLAVHFRVASTHKDGGLPKDLPDVARALVGAIRPPKQLTVKAVDGVSFHIARGETLGLVGESGCGKSTTGRAVMRLERPRAGKVLLDDLDVHRARGGSRRKVRRASQMVFQDPYSSLDPRMTIGEIVREPLRSLGPEKSGKDQRARVIELLDRVGFGERDAGRYPHELSGGQRQRVAIARALAPQPKLLVADEPVSALDVSIQAQIVNLLVELQEELNLSMLFIAHDLAVVRHVSHRIAVMYLGRLVEVGLAEGLVEEPLHPYTRALLSAVPVPDPEIERRRRHIVLGGDVPSPLSPPTGCAFHPRCSEAVDRCAQDAPLLKIGKLERPVACHVAHGEE